MRQAMTAVRLPVWGEVCYNGRNTMSQRGNESMP
jgi:hypothetical protein